MKATLPAITALAALLVGCTASAPAPAGEGVTPAAPAPVLADAETAHLVEGMVQRTLKPLPVERLAAGLTPPTNRWYAGLVFGAEPMPVFPLPLAFALTDGGFAVGLPRVTATPTTIAGGFTADVTVDLGAASSVVVTDDPSVVGLETRDAQGAATGLTTIAQGSPFVSWQAYRATTVSLPSGFAAVGDGLHLATIGGTRYALGVSGGAVAGAIVELSAGGRLALWPVPEGRDPAELAGAWQSIPTGSSVRYSVGDAEVTTELGYATSGDTVLARMPHQVDPSGLPQGCDLGSFPSIYGDLPLCRGSAIRWTTPTTPAVAGLDLARLSSTQRDTLAAQVAEDVRSLPAFPADTYFGGKALQRAAMLLMLAHELGLESEAAQVAGALDAELSLWADPQGCAQRDAFCFVYDPDGRGVVGLTPSFGSEEYNDHHFHYGYFLYAAAVMAGYDPSVVDRYAPVMDLLAADIAGSGGEYFPQRRVFDPYASHSWASGTAPFGDGNNQESVSEAVNAWAGLELWARARGNEALRTQASWLLSLEAAAGTRYWTDPDLSTPAFDGFDHGIVVLNWGGKRDYATWFSAEPAAMLGILLLPMSPSSGYLATTPERIRANVAEATSGRFDQKFGDYLLMYSALAGPEDRARALEIAAILPDDALDDGMSRSYLLAWLLSRTF